MAKTIQLPQAPLIPWRANEPVSAAKLNERDRCLSALLADGAAAPGHRRRGPPVPVFAHFRVQTEEADHVTAYLVMGDGVIEESVKLAKPPSLRAAEYETEIDGTITWAETDENERQATDSDDDSTEDQVIVPQYLLPSGDFKGKLVLAVKGISNGTGVTVNGEELAWQIIDAAAFTEKDQ